MKKAIWKSVLFKLLKWIFANYFSAKSFWINSWWDKATNIVSDVTGFQLSASRAYMSSRYDYLKPSVVGGVNKFQGYTSEGYRIWDGVAYDEFDEAIYNVDLFDDTHPFDFG